MNWFKSKKKQFPKSITVYLSKEYQSILIVPMHVDKSWVHYEQEEIQNIKFEASFEEIGQSLKNSLNKFCEKETNFTYRNKKDWPAFKASKLKTIKEFETKYSRISISGLNESNLILAFDASTTSKDDINLRTTISAHADNSDLGNRLLKIHKAQIEKVIE